MAFKFADRDNLNKFGKILFFFSFLIMTNLLERRLKKMRPFELYKFLNFQYITFQNLNKKNMFLGLGG